jgi:hypothetical protein
MKSSSPGPRADIGDVDGKTLPRHEAYLAAQRCPVHQVREARPTSEITAAILTLLER